MTMNGYQSESEDNSPKPHQICCLVEDKERCKRLAGNASYSKRIQKTVSQKKLKLASADNPGHIYICDYHKNMIQSARSKRKRKESEVEDETETQEVDVGQLQVSTLRRYKRHFKLQTRPGINKAQLVETISRHFKTISAPEKETITLFIYMAKTRKSKLDQKISDTS